MTITISDEIAQEALATLRELNAAETEDRKTDLRRERAATNLLKLYWTQQRYHLNPQTPQDYDRALRHHNQTHAKELEAMTPEDLLALQRQMVAGDYPGKPA